LAAANDRAAALSSALDEARRRASIAELRAESAEEKVATGSAQLAAALEDLARVKEALSEKESEAALAMQRVTLAQEHSSSVIASREEVRSRAERAEARALAAEERAEELSAFADSAEMLAGQAEEKERAACERAASLEARVAESQGVAEAAKEEARLERASRESLESELAESKAALETLRVETRELQQQLQAAVVSATSLGSTVEEDTADTALALEGALEQLQQQRSKVAELLGELATLRSHNLLEGGGGGVTETHTLISSSSTTTTTTTSDAAITSSPSSSSSSSSPSIEEAALISLASQLILLAQDTEGFRDRNIGEELVGGIKSLGSHVAVLNARVSSLTRDVEAYKTAGASAHRVALAVGSVGACFTASGIYEKYNSNNNNNDMEVSGVSKEDGEDEAGHDLCFSPDFSITDILGRLDYGPTATFSSSKTPASRAFPRLDAQQPGGGGGELSTPTGGGGGLLLFSPNRAVSLLATPRGAMIPPGTAAGKRAVAALSSNNKLLAEQCVALQVVVETQAKEITRLSVCLAAARTGEVSVELSERRKECDTLKMDVESRRRELEAASEELRGARAENKDLKGTLEVAHLEAAQFRVKIAALEQAMKESFLQRGAAAAAAATSERIQERNISGIEGQLQHPLSDATTSARTANGNTPLEEGSQKRRSDDSPGTPRVLKRLFVHPTGSVELVFRPKGEQTPESSPVKAPRPRQQPQQEHSPLKSHPRAASAPPVEKQQKQQDLPRIFQGLSQPLMEQAPRLDRGGGVSSWEGEDASSGRLVVRSRSSSFTRLPLLDFGVGTAAGGNSHIQSAREEATALLEKARNSKSRAQASSSSQVVVWGGERRSGSSPPSSPTSEKESGGTVGKVIERSMTGQNLNLPPLSSQPRSHQSSFYASAAAAPTSLASKQRLGGIIRGLGTSYSSASASSKTCAAGSSGGASGSAPVRKKAVVIGSPPPVSSIPRSALRSPRTPSPQPAATTQPSKEYMPLEIALPLVNEIFEAAARGQWLSMGKHVPALRAFLNAVNSELWEDEINGRPLDPGLADTKDQLTAALEVSTRALKETMTEQQHQQHIESHYSRQERTPHYHSHDASMLAVTNKQQYKHLPTEFPNPQYQQHNNHSQFKGASSYHPMPTPPLHLPMPTPPLHAPISQYSEFPAKQPKMQRKVVSFNDAAIIASQRPPVRDLIPDVVTHTHPSISTNGTDTLWQSI